MEIRRLKDDGGHDLDLLGSRDVIGHVTIRLAVVAFLWVVHCDHASILHRCGDMAKWIRRYGGWVKIVSYCTCSIFSLNTDQFSHFFHQ